MPRVLITDKLGSHGVAKRELLPNVEHRKSRYLNNRAETATNYRASRAMAFRVWREG
jgi:putative transposase